MKEFQETETVDNGVTKGLKRSREEQEEKSPSDEGTREKRARSLSAEESKTESNASAAKGPVAAGPLSSGESVTLGVPSKGGKHAGVDGESAEHSTKPAAVTGTTEEVKPSSAVALEEGVGSSTASLKDEQPSRGAQSEPNKVKKEERTTNQTMNDSKKADVGDSRPTDTPMSNEDGSKPGLEKAFLSFPERLLSIIEHEDYSSALWWNPDGTAFCINPKAFTDKVLKHHFQGTKFESFTRKLNRWGFKRILDDFFPPDSVAYRHESFQRGKRDLLKDMNGGKKKDKKLQAAMQTQAPPRSMGLLQDQSMLGTSAAVPTPSSLSRELLRRQILQQNGFNDPLLGTHSSLSHVAQGAAVEQLLATHRLQQLQRQQSLDRSLLQQAEAAAAEQVLTADTLRAFQLRSAGLPLTDQITLRQADQASTAEQLLASHRLQQLQQQQQQLENAAAGLRLTDPMLSLQASQASRASEHLLAAQLQQQRQQQQQQQQQQLGIAADSLLGRVVDQDVNARELRLRLLRGQQLGGVDAVGSNTPSNLAQALMASRGGGGGLGLQDISQMDPRLLELHFLKEQQKRLYRGGRGNP